jgi:hypothetical protein
VLIVTSSAEIVVFLVCKAILKGNLRPSGIPCIWWIPDIPREILISSLKQSCFGAFYEAVIRGLSHISLLQILQVMPMHSSQEPCRR